MTQNEAEKLARKILTTHSYKPVRAVCEYVLSGDMKREIENAAFELAAKLFEPENSVIAKQIRSLIQPPAQKEDGE